MIIDRYESLYCPIAVLYYAFSLSMCHACKMNIYMYWITYIYVPVSLYFVLWIRFCLLEIGKYMTTWRTISENCKYHSLQINHNILKDNFFQDFYCERFISMKLNLPFPKRPEKLSKQIGMFSLFCNIKEHYFSKSSNNNSILIS